MRNSVSYVRRVLLILLAVVLLLSACSTKASTSIKYDIPTAVDNLDPQFATDSTARMIISNIYRGLVRRLPDGSIVPDAALRWTVSADGTEYVFELDRDAQWWSKEGKARAVTAQDFVFAFQRMFDSGTPSPHAQDYYIIKNAADIATGAVPMSELGVRAQNDHTLVIQLERSSPFFIEALSHTAAMPCNRDFFGESMGKYGLGREYLCSNGPYYISRWDNEKQINLLPFVTEGEIPSVYLYITDKEPVARLLSGTTDLGHVPYASVKSASGSLELQGFEKTVWCLVFNLRDPAWGNPLLRQALAASVDREALAGHLIGQFKAYDMLLPPVMRVGGKAISDFGSNFSLPVFDVTRAAGLFELGVISQELDTPPQCTLYVPDTDEHELYAGIVQQSWQQHLSVYVSVHKATAHQIQQQLVDGEYQMLLLPFSPQSPEIAELLGLFESDSRSNYFGYHSDQYDSILHAAGNAPDEESAAQSYAMAQSLLLNDAVIIPLYVETVFYGVDSDAPGVVISPFADGIYFAGN